jgi:hypothetical protein
MSSAGRKSDAGGRQLRVEQQKNRVNQSGR